MPMLAHARGPDMTRPTPPAWVVDGVGSGEGDATLPGTPPTHPGMPARVSELMLPDRGTDARLLEPRDASAVIGSW